MNCTYIHVPEGAAAAAAAQRMSVSTRPTVARREADPPSPVERAAEEVLGLGRVLVWVLVDERLEREPWGGAGARERPRRAVRLLSLPVFLRSMLAAAVGRPPLRCSDWSRWYCSCSCRCRRRSSRWRASRFSWRCFGGGVGGGPLVLSGLGGAAPSWELTLSVLLLLEDSWPALALLVELLVEAEEAVESSLKEPRPSGGRCRSTGPYNNWPSAFLSTPPTMVATGPPGGRETARPAGPRGDVGDSIGEREEVRGGGGGGRRCSPPTRPALGAAFARLRGWRGSSLWAAADAALAARGSVLAAPG